MSELMQSNTPWNAAAFAGSGNSMLGNTSVTKTLRNIPCSGGTVEPTTAAAKSTESMATPGQRSRMTLDSPQLDRPEGRWSVK